MRRPRILVVDDDEALAKSYRSALRVAGFDARIAGDGLAALDELDKEHRNRVVLELQVPQLHGQTAVREAAATPDTHAIQIIVLATADPAASNVKASAALCESAAPGSLPAGARRYLH